MAINKIDIPEVSERIPELRAEASDRGIEPYFISAAGGEGVSELLSAVATRLKELREEEADAQPETEAALPIIRPKERGVRVAREDGAYRVDAEKPVAFAEMMPLDTDEGRAELWRRFQRWGVTGALKRAGAKRGDTVRLGRVQVEMEG